MADESISTKDITFVNTSPTSLIKGFLYRRGSGLGNSGSVKVISEGIVTADQLDQELAVLEHRIVQKLMELSQRISELEKEVEDLRGYLAIREQMGRL